MKTLAHILIALLFLPTVLFAQSTLPAGGTGWSTSTKGDLLVGTSSALRYSRLPVGQNNYFLRASSTSSIGLEWISTSTIASLLTGFATSGQALWGGSLSGNISNLNTGNVGIGTITPSMALDVVSANDNEYDAAKFESNNQTQYTSIGWRGLFASNVLGYNATGDGATAHSWYVGGTEKMTMLTNGNLGIGVTNPSSKLYVVESHTTPNVANTNAINLETTYAPSSDETTFTNRGAFFNSIKTGAFNSNDVRGFQAQAENQGAGDMNGLYGFLSNTSNIGAGTIGSAAAAFLIGPGGTGPITNAYGVIIDTQKRSGVTNAYGIYQVGVNDNNLLSGSTTLSYLATNSAVYTDSNKVLTTAIPSSGTLGYWSRSGTNTFLANTGDRVGIATSSPTNKFVVIDEDNSHQKSGIAYFAANNQTVGTSIGYGGVSAVTPSGTGNVALYLESQGTQGVYVNSNGGGLAVNTTDSENDGAAIVVSALGNINIRMRNATVPTFRSDIFLNNAGAAGWYNYDDSSGLFQPFSFFGRPIAFNENTVDNMGIGTNSPSQKLVVRGFGGSTNGIFNVASSSNDSFLYVTSGGNVGISTTTPADKLSIIGNMFLSGAFRDGTNNATGTPGQMLISTGTSTVWASTAVVQKRRTTAYTLTNTFADVGFDVTDIQSATSTVFASTTATSTIQIGDTGLYMIQYHGDEAQGTNINDGSIQVVKNAANTLISGSEQTVKNSSSGRSAMSAVFYANLTAGEYLKLQARYPASSGGSISNLVFTVEKK